MRRTALACLLASLVACPRAPIATPPPKPTHAPATSMVWSYDVDVASLDDVVVDASFTAGSDDVLAIRPDVRPFVHDVTLEGPGGSVPARSTDDGWAVGCRVGGCRVRYRIRLRDVAKKIDSADEVIATGGAVVTTPSIWMLRPLSAASAGIARFHVSGGTYVTGLDRAKDQAADTYELAFDDVDGASFVAFGPLRVQHLSSGASTIDVGILPGAHELDASAVTKWVGADTDAVARYYGAYPVPHVLVLIMPTGDKVTRGVTLADGGPALLVRIGKPISDATLADDWVVTHEMMHVAFPSLDRDMSWLAEGLASYVEPFVRARVGMIDDVRVWKDLLDGLPQGNPAAGDQGLAKTHTWERTYWGGALFCLVADVTIRERTKNARSLDDALRSIQRQGGTVRAHWSIEKVLDEADAATGTHVLHELYETMALAPGKVDLPALYARLGVSLGSSGIKFDDAAPLAVIRRSMTARLP